MAPLFRGHPVQTPTMGLEAEEEDLAVEDSVAVDRRDLGRGETTFMAMTTIEMPSA